MAVCFYCKKIIPDDAKFCVGCGKAVASKVVRCSKCGSYLKPTAKFCPKCGETAPKFCPFCDKSLKPLAKFCVSCGKAVPDGFWSSENTCVNCGAPLKPEAKFCTCCGAPVKENASSGQPSTQAAVKPIAEENSDNSAQQAAEQQARIEEEKRRLAEEQAKEQARIEEEKRRLAEEQAKEQARIEEEKRRLAEEQAKEQARIEEEKRRLAEEQAKEQARIEEEKRRLAEEQAKEQARIEEEKSKTQEQQPAAVQNVSKSAEKSSAAKGESAEKQSETAAKSKATPAAKPAKKLPIIPIVIGGVVVLAGAVVAAILFLFGSSSELDTYFQDKFTYDKIVDSRDNQEYRTIKIGNQVWIAQNMNYKLPNSLCDSCELYGRYYTHSQVDQVCPEGFNVPTVTDFMELQRYDASQLKSIKGWANENNGSDELGFVSIPAGFVSFKERAVKRRGETSGFWTSIGDGYSAARMKIEKDGAPGGINALDVRYGFPVRCISSNTSRMSEEDNVILDSKSESLYKMVLIGNQRWLTKNVDVKLPKSYCYEDSPENCDEYGRLYEWSAALKACPFGTRLPNAADIAELKKNSNAIAKLNLQYGGVRNAKGVYDLKGSRADMWTSSEFSASAKYWYVTSGENKLQENKFNKKGAVSVRCIVGDLVNEVKYATITDDRDDQEYSIVNVGTQTWMAQNLNYDLPGSFCYNYDNENCSKYGRLYVYSDAKEICPEGFHLPDDTEWQTLKNYVSDHGNGEIATMLKGSSEWSNPGKDFWGMNILPSGYRSEEGEFGRLGERAYLWSDSELDMDSAYHWAIVDGVENLSKTSAYKNNSRGVRCIADYYMTIQSEGEIRALVEREPLEYYVLTEDDSPATTEENVQKNSTGKSILEKASGALESLNREYEGAKDEYDRAVRTVDEGMKTLESINHEYGNAKKEYDRAVRDAGRAMKSFGF